MNLKKMKNHFLEQWTVSRRTCWSTPLKIGLITQSAKNLMPWLSNGGCFQVRFTAESNERNKAAKSKIKTKNTHLSLDP